MVRSGKKLRYYNTEPIPAIDMKDIDMLQLLPSIHLKRPHEIRSVDELPRIKRPKRKSIYSCGFLGDFLECVYIAVYMKKMNSTDALSHCLDHESITVNCNGLIESMSNLEFMVKKLKRKKKGERERYINAVNGFPNVKQRK